MRMTAQLDRARETGSRPESGCRGGVGENSWQAELLATCLGHPRWSKRRAATELASRNRRKKPLRRPQKGLPRDRRSQLPKRPIAGKPNSSVRAGQTRYQASSPDTDRRRETLLRIEQAEREKAAVIPQLSKVQCGHHGDDSANGATPSPEPMMPLPRLIAVVGKGMGCETDRVSLPAYDETSSSAHHQSSPQTKYGWT
jgi:hypothetical protein